MPDSSRSLFDHAKKVFDLNAALRNQEIAAVSGRVFTAPLWSGPQLLLAQSRYANGAFYRAYHIDLGEQLLLPRPRLSEIIHNFRGSWSLSSDRKWVLWREGWLEARYRFTATRSDGSLSVQWTVDGDDEHHAPYFWLPESHFWIRFLIDEGANSPDR